MRLLVCIDFSPVTDAVVSEAAALATASRGQIALLHVARTEPGLTTAGIGPRNGHRVPPEDLDDRRTRMEAIADELGASDLPVWVDVELTDKDVHEAILAAAKARGIQYIVMGNHGRSRAYEILVGSVTQGVLRGAQVPVIVVPRPPTDE
jgi:nucleotide-binding universal stress UspA family protein